ncbi:MAG: site-specific DNA-methyltransferase, partial [Chloroflexota bacterium]|nr:site-specific DNA-methyltransferase [Chloroflexota bacterium]
MQAELEERQRTARTLGMDEAAINDLPPIRELRAKLAETADATSVEGEIYSDLYTFFSRYYKDGDFVSLRRYKPGVYAIPYEGEEVKLHWANADQYYVKSSEAFQDYRFRLPDGRYVHFKLAAAVTERDNNKAADGQERRFVLRAEDPVEEVGGELHVYFEYRPGGEKQVELNRRAVARLMELPDAEAWKEGLSAPAPTQSAPGRTCLEKHLADYTARNSFDYFIHKDLGGFLRRELDFFLKNEVLHVDDLDT